MPHATRRRTPKVATKKKAKRKLSVAQALEFCRSFVRPDAASFFLQTWEPACVAWMMLLKSTSIPSRGPLTARRLTGAVEALEAVISGEQEPELPARFGYLQLFNFIESLKSRIELDKRRGLIEAESCRINATRAYQIYLNAQGNSMTATRLRHLRQIGGRWKDATRSSALLLLIFSVKAESFA